MKLIACFYSEDGAPCDRVSSRVGLDFVDMARRKTGVPALTLSVIWDGVPSLYLHPHICVPEETARESGLFGLSSDVEVEVPAKFLNRFTSVDFRTSTDERTGAITSVSPFWSLDEDAVLEAWQEAGYPVQWGDEQNPKPGTD